VSAAEPARPADHAFELVPEPGDEWRAATLVYREGEHVLAVELERGAASATGWLALDSSFCEWSVPRGLALAPEHTDRVLARLAAWCARTGLRIELAPAVDPLVELSARGYALAHHPDGSVTALAPRTRPRGFLARLFGR